MSYSANLSHLFLRLGLTFVFLWFGIDKFVNPGYWINAWVPLWFQGILASLGIETLNFIYINGIFEIVIGLGFLFNLFVKFFAFLAILFLLLVVFSFGLNEVTVRDVGLAGGVLALLFWNDRKKY
jgi:uncharacterized membrane protein YphA (DoxX/SURF4 family)